MLLQFIFITCTYVLVCASCLFLGVAVLLGAGIEVISSAEVVYSLGYSKA